MTSTTAKVTATSGTTLQGNVSGIPAGRLKEIATLAEAAGEMERAQKVAAVQVALEDPVLQVAVFGEFNRGKSTLINALLGRVVLPAKLIPTTGHVTTLVYGTKEEVRLQLKDGRIENYPLDQLDKVASLRADGSTRADIRSIEVVVNHPMLRDTRLLDTPGMNEAEASSRRTQAAIEVADLVLVMLDARELLGQSERSLVAGWLQKEWGKPVVPVLNFMNHVTTEDATLLRKRLTSWCGSHVTCWLEQPWYEVNALGALKYQLGKASEPVDDFLCLQHALTQMTASLREELQRHSRYHRVRKTLAELAQQNSRTMAALRADAKRVEQERASQRQAVAARQRRFASTSDQAVRQLFANADKALADELSKLVNSLAGKARDQLTVLTPIAYELSLTSCIQQIEESALSKIQKLARGAALTPPPFGLAEQMTLASRIAVGKLSASYDEDSSVLWGGIGMVVGSALIPIPVVGAVVGAAIGGMVSAWWTRKEPDYVAAYRAQVEKAWQADSTLVKLLLKTELEGVIEEMVHQLGMQAAAVTPMSGGVERELSLRTHLAQAIEQYAPLHP